MFTIYVELQTPGSAVTPTPLGCLNVENELTCVGVTCMGGPAGGLAGAGGSLGT